MRFKRSDLPGIVIALAAGPALMLLFLASSETWDHQGTPILGFMGTNLGVAVGLAAVFSRFIRNWDWPIGFAVAIVLVVLAVNWAQHTDNDGTRLATGLKWVGIVAFVGLNISVGWQLLTNGVLPILERMDARRAAEAGDS